MPGFRVGLVDLDSGCRELRVEGELDLAVVDQLRQHLDAAVKDGLEVVVVSLDQCEFIDSTGIAAILLAHKVLAEKGCRLVVCEPSQAVRRVLAVTGLDKDGFLYPSAEAALDGRSGTVSDGS